MCNMKKFIAGFLAIVLTAAVSIGATLAYLTDTDEDVNVMTLGKVKIDQLEYERIDVETKDDEAEVQEFHDNKPLLPAVTEDGLDYAKPGDTYVDWEQIGKDGYTSPIWNPDLINNEVDKMVFVKNKGDYDAYVRSVFAFEAGNYTTLDEFNAKVHLNLNEIDWTWEWVSTPVTIGESTYFIATATYNKVLAPGALTEISLSQIALDSSATNEDVEAFGDTYQVLVKSQAVQAAGFTDPDTALNEGFGVIDANNAPWDTDSAIRGIDLRTALHYYEGDRSNQITTKVANVIYGDNASYTDITDKYTGTLVDVEQDVPVYAYYVPNGTNYDVYFLANDVIHSPKDSSSLYKGMSALTTVDTTNYAVSRVEKMQEMFSECGKLTTLDTTGWDTSKVTDLTKLFYRCYELQEVPGIENWDMSNIESMFAMFARAYKLKELDVGSWDTGNVTNMNAMFQMCFELEYLDVGNWDVSKVTDFGFLFKGTGNKGDMKINNLDISKWDTSSAKTFQCMFYGCGQITEMDLSTWNTDNLEDIGHMFADCYKLEKVNFAGWNTPKLKTVDALFNNCGSLKSVDVSYLNTENVVEFSQAFEYCYSLEEIIGLDKWVTTNGQDFGEMFTSCSSLKVLDLSSFDTTNAQDSYVNASNGDGNDRFHYFLTGCNSLEKIILSENFSFDGDGSFTKWTFEMPSATNVNGWDGYWYNAETGVAYLPGEIPEETAATYVAVNPSANP